MEIKIRGMDQITAWVVGFIAASAIFAILWFVSKRAFNQNLIDQAKNAEIADNVLKEQEKKSAQRSPLGEVQSENIKPEASVGKPNESDDRWGYTGTIAPWRWMDLDPAWSLCGKGKAQSPIDIAAAKTDNNLKGLRLHYRHGTTRFSLHNQTVQGDIETGSWMDIDGERFDLNTVSFHTPGEHLINGLPFEMEIQWSHSELSGKKVILALQVAVGKGNPVMDRIGEVLPRFSGDTQSLSQLNWNDLLPSKLTYWTYRGSTTTPPCHEDISWYVLTEPIHAGAKQIDKFVILQKNNARSPQALHGRTIARSNR